MPAQIFELDDASVHVWSAVLDPGRAVLDELWPTLAPDEQGRARRFHFERDRVHFIAGRGFLRRLLGAYLDEHPARIRFQYGPYGKPALDEAYAAEDLHFNLSHAGGRALYAFSRHRPVGIDIERIRPEVATEQLAERFFSVHEVEALKALPPEVRHEAFFNCWTRKEAFIKARGDGLTLPLDQFAVTLAPGEPVALLHTRWDPTEVDRWTLYALPTAAGFKGALATAGQDARVVQRVWTPSPDPAK